MAFPTKHPFTEMQVGETRIVEKAPKAFVQYTYKRGLELGRKFRTKRIGDDVRLERIA